MPIILYWRNVGNLLKYARSWLNCLRAMRRGAVHSTSAFQGNPTTFYLRRGMAAHASTFNSHDGRQGCRAGTRTQSIMKRPALLLLSLLISLLASRAETWTPVGQAEWHEGIVSKNYSRLANAKWNVTIERSDERPNVFRMQPYSNHPASYKKYNGYAYIHIESGLKIYFERFQCFDSSQYSDYSIITQRCIENGFDTKYYGKVTEDNTIEFPVGSFEVQWKTESTFYSIGIHKIVFPDGVLGHTPTPETWVSIGQGRWEDPFWTLAPDGEPVIRDITIEKSVTHPNNYRAKVFGEEYVTIFTGNPSKVYISPYTHTNTSGNIITVTQDCAENGRSGSRYGTLSNGRVTIPGDCFVMADQAGTTATGSSSRKCEITFPGGFDNPLPEDNGVFMGIVAFNDEIHSKQISRLDESTREDFTSFVDGLGMTDATLLYYAVDQAIGSMKAQTFPDNLSNAVLVTFTDGLDQGSLAMKPEHRTSRGYASYLSGLIGQTAIQGHPLEAYAIGLMSDDVYDDELFTYNLQSLASSEDKVLPVNNIAELQQKLSDLFDNLDRQTTQRVVTIKVPMMSHGDKYRFTLDHSKDGATESDVWFEGVFNIDDMSLENITYNGFTSTSGLTLTARQEGIRILFTLTDCRGLDGGILNVDKDGIDQWQYISSRDIWNHNKENAKAEDIDIQNIKSSVAVMFALDCSTSLGDLFPLVKSTANSFINRLAGVDDGTGIGGISTEDDEEIDINDPDVRIYNLQGVRVDGKAPGLYIVSKGSRARKMLIR